MQTIFIVEAYPQDIVLITRSPSKALAKAVENNTYVIREYLLDIEYGLKDSYFSLHIFEEKYC